ncbi:GNAT family N-acetyltransferase [Haladaptatus salinisoli]|uniref:GNAT family N-acetyltransferase n=1 Tax=Haladaptatus salinisoli TaxID=2884876 RepID=UPI001D0B0C64|nr:GNAT family N-acetyltransferase [Haladaptatus salinisoli]
METDGVEIRPYDANDEDDAKELWKLKRGFELGLGEGTGGDDKAAVYAEKLTDEYRQRYREWVERCASADERCVTVADAGDELAGYVFVLPDDFAFVWDAAVLNEIFVRPDHRGTGVADELMDAAVDFARDQTLPLGRLVLDVDRENARARSFYDRHGFEHWGEMVAREL